MPFPAEHFQKAKFKYDAAFHLFKVTYPLIKDSRLLLGVIDNIFESMQAAMDGLLEFERSNHRLLGSPQEFESKMLIFRNKVVPLYNIPFRYIGVMSTAKKILNTHKKASVEFQRGGKMVICNNNYREIELVTVEKVQEFLQQTQEFFALSESITKKDTT